MRISGRARRLRSLLFVLVIATAALTAWLWIERDHPPIDELYAARTYLNLVQDTAKEEEAGPILAAARENLTQAQNSLRAQYRRLVLFRNYDLTRYQIRRAHDLCNDALSTARVARQNSVQECQKRLASLRTSLKATRSLVERMTAHHNALTHLATAQARLDAADACLAEHRVREVKELLGGAEEEIAGASNAIQSHLAAFLSRRQQWDAWIKETLAWSSRTDRPALIVDKLNHQCYVIRRGRVVDSYNVELGGMWMSQKVREGDRATPEGRYHVAQVKGSRYYRAALLNYPNESDRSRFVRAKRQGDLPRSARIGGLIEIHGEGGRGVDWTAGCVSLANRDIDRLFRHVSAGTPVTIVGLWQEPDWLGAVGGRRKSPA